MEKNGKRPKDYKRVKISECGAEENRLQGRNVIQTEQRLVLQSTDFII